MSRCQRPLGDPNVRLSHLPWLLPNRGLLRRQVVVDMLSATVSPGPEVVAADPGFESSEGVPIKIAELVAPPTVDCDMQCVRLMPNRVAKWWSLSAAPWRDFSLAFDGSPIRFHDSTIAALALANAPEMMPTARHVHVYTDGSEKNGETGWAAVVVQWDEDNSAVTLLGAFGGQVDLDVTSCRFIAATEPDSRNAELSALTWSLLWTIANWESLGLLSVTLHFDSTTAGFATNGLWSTGSDPLAQKARHLAQACEACTAIVPVYWKHVEAHAGQPWNECADSIAEAMRCRIAPTVSQPRLPDGVDLGVADISRLRLTVLCPDVHAFPRTCDEVANWSEAGGQLTVMSPEQIVPLVSRTHARPWHLHLRSVSVNVQSAVGKHAFLEQQFESQQIAIAFLQEMKEQGSLVKSARFLRYGSDSEVHWGVAVWLSRTVPVENGRDPALSLLMRIVLMWSAVDPDILY